MNREILFRGKRVDNGEWVFGPLLNNRTAMEGSAYIIPFFVDSSNFDYIEVYPYTVGQLHNGLTRKAGSNVFVGDIIRHDLEAGLGQPKRTGIVSEITSIEFDFHYYSNVRLLGNKFDNPELTLQS